MYEFEEIVGPAGLFHDVEVERRVIMIGLDPQRRLDDSIKGVAVTFVEFKQQQATEPAVVELAAEPALVELAAADDALRDAPRRRDEFVAILLHELRNTLTAIELALMVVARGDAGDERTVRASATVARRTEHLRRLVDHLLIVTRIARGKFQLRGERFARGPIAQDHVSILTAGGVTRVTNDSIGLAPMILAHLCDPFAQGGSTLDRAHG